MSNRTILSLAGPDTKEFLQNLITNDIDKLDQGLVYAALLTPQGKYLADFFLFQDESAICLDAPDTLGDSLLQRLSLYKLRADVSITKTDLYLHQGTGETPPDGFDDPRHPAMGWRAYRPHPQSDPVDLTPQRIAHVIPEAGAELHKDTFILEAGFERLNGVDFRKGCYVGQEVTARMKHKTTLRKGLTRITLSESVPPDTQITAGGKPIGIVHSVCGNDAIAYLRFDRISDDMIAGAAKVTCHTA